MGQHQEALEAYREAVSLAPGYAPAWLGLGAAEAELGHLDEAVAALRQAVALAPGDALAWRGLGELEAFRGRPCRGRRGLPRGAPAPAGRRRGYRSGCAGSRRPRRALSAAGGPIAAGSLISCAMTPPLATLPALARRQREPLAWVGLYAALAVGWESRGGAFKVWTDLWQLLPWPALFTDLSGSLLDLHSQPPLLNLLFGLSLKASVATGARLETLLQPVFLVAGAVTVFALAAVATRVIARPWPRRAVMLLVVANPYLHAVFHQLFYTAWELLFLSLLALLALRHLEQPSPAGWPRRWRRPCCSSTRGAPSTPSGSSSSRRCCSPCSGRGRRGGGRSSRWPGWRWHWCWPGPPRTWPGSASSASRAGPA